MDRKRIKAKVGKRAPQKVNATDTSFQTAKIQVRPQTSIAASSNNNKKDGSKEHEKNDNLELISSRGKPLNQLLTSLSHHAATVRQSALQGIRDAIQRKIKLNHNSCIVANLSMLMSSLSRCLVDENTAVRSSALTIIRELIQYCTKVTTDEKSSNQERDSSKFDDQVMLPFLPLTKAYVSSALNSLDSDIRHDGCLAVDLLYSHYGHNINNDNNILSAFVRLLTDASQRKKSTSSKSISKKNKNKTTTGDNNHVYQMKNMAVLKSLISVLQCDESLESNDTFSTSSFHAGPYSYFHDNNCQFNAPSLLPSLIPHDMIFLQGGYQHNALLLFHSKEQQKTKHIIHRDITSLQHQHDQLHGSISQHKLPIEVFVEILSKLRDRFLEITQQKGDTILEGRSSLSNDHGLLLPVSCLEEFSLLVTSFRLLWRQYGMSFLSSSGSDHMDDSKKKLQLYRISYKLLDNLRESFPLIHGSGGDDHRLHFQNINASVGSTISELGSTLVMYEKENDSVLRNNHRTSESWIQTIFSFLLPQLEDHRSRDIVENQSTNHNDDTSINQSQKNVETSKHKVDDDNIAALTSMTLLKVIGHLLLGTERSHDTVNESSQFTYLLDDEVKRADLLDKFGDAFFPPRKSSTFEVDNDCASRRSVMLLCALLTQQMKIIRYQQQQDPNNHHNVDILKKLLEMATQLPNHISVWGSSYELETNVVLGVLLSIVRTHRCNDEKEDNTINGFVRTYVDNIKSSIPQLLFCMSKKKIKTRDINGIVSNSKITVFEQLRDTSQYLLISIIGLLKSPSDILVNEIAQICSRRTIAVTIRDYYRCLSSPDTEEAQMVQVKNKLGIFVNDTIVEYIMEVMFSIRKTVSKQAYFLFLITSLGLEPISKHLSSLETVLESKNDNNEVDSTKSGSKRKRDKDNDEEMDRDLEKDSAIEISTPIGNGRILISDNFDVSLALVCRYLSYCGGMELLSVLSPVLMSWVRNSQSTNSNHHIKKLLHSRTTVSILATFTSSIINSTTSSMLYNELPQIKQPLIDLICDQYLSSPYSPSTNRYGQLFAPIKVRIQRLNVISLSNHSRCKHLFYIFNHSHVCLFVCLFVCLYVMIYE